MKQLKAVCLCVLAFTMLTLTGCGQGTPPVAPGFQEDAYGSELFASGKWSVKFDRKALVEVDSDGTIHIYGISEQQNGSTVWPNIKVSGEARFAVHSCNRLTVTDNAMVQAYQCTLVRACKGTSVTGYNCGLIEAYGEVKSVMAHGSTQLKKLPEPGTPLVEKPASTSPETGTTGGANRQDQKQSTPQ